MRVIDALEVVRIEHQQAGKAALALGPVQRLLRTQDQETTVGQLDQRIHPAEPLQLAVLRFDPARQLPAENAQADAIHEQERDTQHDRALRGDRLVREAERPPGQSEAQQQGQRGTHRQANATGSDLVGHQQCGEQCTGHRAQRHEGDPATAEKGVGHHAAELDERGLGGALGQHQCQRRPRQRVEQQQGPCQRPIVAFEDDRSDGDCPQSIADETHPADATCRANAFDRAFRRIGEEWHCPPPARSHLLLRPLPGCLR